MSLSKDDTLPSQSFLFPPFPQLGFFSHRKPSQEEEEEDEEH